MPNTTRVNIALSLTLIERLDNIAELLGMTRSQLCTYFIGQGCISYETSLATIGQLGQDIAQQLTFKPDELKKE